MAMLYVRAMLHALSHGDVSCNVPWRNLGPGDSPGVGS